MLEVQRSGLTRKLMCDRSLPSDLVDALWDDPDRQLIHQATVLQEKDRCMVLRVYNPQLDPFQQSFLLKRHVWGTASRTARMLWRKPTAIRCAAISAMLAENNIPVPQVRGCVVDGVGPLSFRSYLLTDFISGSTLFHAIRAGTLPAGSLQNVARQVAEIWQKLIGLNISHNDLKPENFMVDESLRVWLIDFEKTKFHRDQNRLCHRHIEDVQRFLHIRSWREHTEAAEVFRQELLQTTLKSWANESNMPTCHLLRQGYLGAEIANRISVIIPASRKDVDRLALVRTIDSVRDVADEILLVEPNASTVELQVWHTLDKPADVDGPLVEKDNLLIDAEAKKPQYPWVLVLNPGERATPDLVRQLPEWVIDSENTDAFNLPIEVQSSKRSLNWRQRPATMAPRVFRQGHCKFALVHGEPKIAASEDRVATKSFGLVIKEAGQTACSFEIPADESDSRSVKRSKADAA